MKLTVKKPFSWAHRGVTVEHFEAGQTIETEDQDLIDVSTKEGWTSKAAPKQPTPLTPPMPPTPLQPTPAQTPAPPPPSN